MKFVIPGRTKSTANLREHHHAKAKRFAAERRKAMQMCPKWEGPPLLVVTLFRFGARELDSDNLANSLKAHRDGIAARLKVDDGSKLLRWEYRQATCPFGEERVEVVVEVTPYETALNTALRDMTQTINTTISSELAAAARGPQRLRGLSHAYGVATPASYPRRK